MANEVELERMVIRLVGEGSSYQKMITTAVNSTQQAARTMERHAKEAEVFGKTIDQLGTHMSNFAGQMRAMAALQSPFEFIKDGVKLAAATETMETSFGTLLQDMGKGKDLMKDLIKFAADTPLTLTNITPVSKELLQAGVTVEEMIPTMRMLGDAVNGNAQNMAHLGHVYAQVRMQNRLLGNDQYQFTNAGVGIMNLLSKSTGKSVAELREMSEKGALSFQMVEEALTKATSAGGQFFDGMKNGSKTLEGLWSTMKDDVDGAKRAVGGAVIEAFHLKDAVKEVSKAAQDFTTWFNKIDQTSKDVASTTAILVGSFGSLVVIWKVGAITTGIVVGVMKDVVITSRWAAASFWELGTATAFTSKVNVQTAASARLLALDEEIAARASQDSANMQAYLAAQASKAAVAQHAAAAAAVEQANANALLLGPVSSAKTATTLQAEANAFAAAQSAKSIALTKEATKVNWAAVASSAALHGGLVVLGTYLLGEGVTAIIGGNKAMREFNEALADGAKLTERMADVMQRNRNEVMDKAKAITNADDRKSFLSKELETATKNAEGLSQRLEEVRQRIERVRQKGDSLGAVGRTGYHFAAETVPSVFGMSTEQDILKKQLDELAASSEAARRYVEDLKRMSSKAIPETNEAVAALIRKFQDEAVTMRMTNEEKEIYKLRSQGATDAALREAEAWAKMIKQSKEIMEKRKQINDGIKETSERLETELRTLTMTNDERDLYKLSMKGATEAELANARGLAEMNKYLTETKKLMDEGKRVTDQFMDPQLKFAERVATLNNLLSSGAIDVRTYGEAVKEAASGLVRTGDSAKKAREEVQRFDAALANSAEGNARVAAFKDMINMADGRNITKAATVGTANYGFANQLAGSVVQNPTFDQAKTHRIMAESAGINAGVYGAGASERVEKLLEVIALNTGYKFKDGQYVPILRADLE